MIPALDLGKRTWLIAGGHIPLFSTGEEPRFTSRDVLCVLNATGEDTAIRLTVFYADRPPISGYVMEVKSRRVRHIRVNDLIDPEPVYLDTPYAVLLTSDQPVVVQFSRMDTGQARLATVMTNAFAQDMDSDEI